MTVSFCCGIVYSRVKRTLESEKKKTYVYLITRKIKTKLLVYVPGTYISPFVLALEGGVNSNPSSREVILEDGKSETDRTQTVTHMADTKRAAAHRRPGPERGVATYRQTPEREQTVFYPTPSIIFRTG